MSRSRAHLLVTHVPVGPFAVTHHFPHHYPKAPDVTRCRMFSMCDDLWGCPAKHTTWALGVRLKVTAIVTAEVAFIGATALGSDGSQGLHTEHLSILIAPLQDGCYYPCCTDREPEAHRDVHLCKVTAEESVAQICTQLLRLKSVVIRGKGRGGSRFLRSPTFPDGLGF